MRTLILLLFLLHTSIDSFCQAKLKPLIPDRSLTSFIEELKEAVAGKDKVWIIKNMHPDMKNSFGGDGGIEEFKQYWDWAGDASDFWMLLTKIIDLGGGTMTSEDSYSMPYVFSHWPDKYDPFDNVAITGTNVNVRDKPSVDGSEVLGQFNYDIVSIIRSNSLVNDVGGLAQYYLWSYVESQDETLKGYVYGDFVWSPIGYRIGFQKKNKKWQITFLVAGD